MPCVHSPPHRRTNEAERRRRGMPPSGVCQQRIEFAGLLEGIEIVASADIRLAHEYLRHGLAALRLRFHLGARVAVGEHVDFLDLGAFFLQELLGPNAIGADGRGVHSNALHRLPVLVTRYSAMILYSD